MFRLSKGVAAVASLALCAVNPPPLFASLQDVQEVSDVAAAEAHVTAQFVALQTEAGEAQTAWRKDQIAQMQAAREAGAEFSRKPFPFQDYRDRAIKLAEQAGAEAAPQILVWVVQSDSSDPVANGNIVRTLAEKHVSSPALAPLQELLPYFDYFFSDPKEAAATLLRIEKGSSVPALRAHAQMTRLKPAMTAAELGTEAYTKMKAELMNTVREMNDEAFTGTVEKFITVREEFGMGCTPDDIVGMDLDGVEFKLSDYRGKVVFLDFWGDW